MNPLDLYARAVVAGEIPAGNRGTISERPNRVTGPAALTTTSRTGGGAAMATSDSIPERKT